MTTEQADQIIALLTKIERRLFHVELKIQGRDLSPSEAIFEEARLMGQNRDKRIAAIKWLREQPGMEHLGLAEAKAIVEGAA
ncbi:MAG TPA: hypothetical protein VNX46_12725 [Candidatus Acidoferrum sp.]|jgi:ribosomal protein L7/L12|nr:hypothetical protein [Candidatus Acidoferrum sp.]